MRVTDFSIRSRIGAGFFVLVAFTLLLGVLSLNELAKVAATTEDIATARLPGVQLSSELRVHLNDIRRAEARHLLSSARKEMRALEAQMANTRNRLQELDAAADRMFTSEPERQALAIYRQHRSTWYAANEKMAPLSRAGKQDEATELYNGESNTAFDGAMDALIKLSDLNTEAAATAWESSKVKYQTSQLWLMVGVGATVVLAALMAFRIARSIARPIELAVRAAQDIAEGDMTVSLTATGKDETAKLLQALEQMRARLAEVVSTVRMSSGLFAHTTAEIVRSNQDLADRTAMQYAALERTTTSMQQLGAAVRRNSDTAQAGNRLAESASAVVARGRDAVSHVTQTMQGIAQSSNKIAEITGIIDGIAFQTNILALNAAVEAARAGEQGRGFAVVASEVRTLAGRCSQAAREIKQLIQSSVQQVRAGTEEVEQAGATMLEVVSSIQNVSTLIGEISSSSGEQLHGVATVGDAVGNIDEVAQHNLILVQELAQAVGNLESQAAALVQTVAVFKLEDTGEPQPLGPALAMA